MPKISRTIFREYDIRGIADSELTDEVVFQIAQAYGTYIQNFGIKELVVGRDNRLSSERIRNVLINSLLQTGCDVIDIGLTLAPIFYFSIVNLQKKGGVMITASHNPKEYNGLKMCKGGYLNLFGEEIRKIGEIAQKGKFKKGAGKLSFCEPFPGYVQMLKEKITIKKPIKIVLDCGNGTASLFAPKIFKDFGFEIIEQCCVSDPNFPRHVPNPQKKEFIEHLRQGVLREKDAIGLGIDGDADRIGAMDETGREIFGDELMILYSREVLKNYPGAKIVFDVKSSLALEEEIKSLEGKPIIWKTGHSLIKAKMEEEKAVFGGEMSGHIYFADEFFGFDDAIYACLRLLRIMSESGKKLHELLSDIPKYFFTPELRLHVPEEKKFEIAKELQEYFKKKYKVIDIDGARVIFDGGWGLIRASNTEPALIVRCEGKTPEVLEKIKKIIFEKLEKYGVYEK